MRHLRTYLLVALLALLAAGQGAWAQTSGTCGENVTWSYDTDTKTLTISGTGAIKNYPSGDQPWADYISDITTLVIGDGVTKIGTRAFFNHTNLATLNGAGGVSIINLRAFDLTAWNSNLPEGLTYVGHVAYKFKGDGTSVTLDANTTQIADIAFAWSSIASITIPSGVTDIGDNAFASSALISAIIPASVTSIGSKAFSECYNLEKVYNLATTPQSNNQVFYHVKNYNSAFSIIVPAVAYADYAGNNKWSNSGTITPGYTVTCDEGITATSFAPIVAQGETVTLSGTGHAPSGYVFAGYSVKDAGNNDVTVNEDNGVYTFTMPASDVTVSAIFEENKWSELQTQLTNSSSNANAPTVITLTEDIVANSSNSYLNIPAGHHVIIDLNGHTIDRNLTDYKSNGHVIQVRGTENGTDRASLTIRDTQGGGTITGGFNSSEKGGGIYVANRSTLTLESGNITGNKCENNGGGGVNVAYNSTFRMTGGSITGNVGNTRSGGSFHAAGAVYLKQNSHFYLSGGSITGNLCGGHNNDQSGYDDCGGIGFDSEHEYVNRIHLGGSYTLSGNLLGSYSNGTLTNSIPSDYLHTQKNVIVIEDAISPTAPAVITVSDKSKQACFTSGWGSYMTADPATCFTLSSFYDTDGKGIYLVSDELYITTPEALYWHADADHDGSTEERAYIISTPAGLDYLASVVNYDRDCGGLFFRLGADIAYDPDVLDANGENYTAIGSWILVGNSWFARRFEGTFNGDGHTVSGIRIHKTGNTDGDKYQGLFGEMGFGSTVKNVIVSDAVISGCTFIGGIAGENSGTIENCRVTATVTVSANDNTAGGILGNNNNGTVRGCTSAATVSGQYNIGGIVGYISNSSTIASIENCLAMNASVTATDYYGGAIVGRNSCYSGNYLSILSNNVYSGCTVTNGSGPAQTTGIGCGNKADGTKTPTDVTTMTVNNVTYTNGAVPAPADPGLTLAQGTKDDVSAWWGTYYNGTFSYTLPEGAAAYTMGSDYKLYRLGTDGRTIPAGKAVVIIADKQNITLTLSAGDSTVTDHAPGGNQLQGSGTAIPDGKSAYILSVDTGGTIGFRKYTGTDAIPAGKAYYVQ